MTSVLLQLYYLCVTSVLPLSPADSLFQVHQLGSLPLECMAPRLQSKAHSRSRISCLVSTPPTVATAEMEPPVMQRCASVARIRCGAGERFSFVARFEVGPGAGPESASSRNVSGVVRGTAGRHIAKPEPVSHFFISSCIAL